MKFICPESQKRGSLKWGNMVTTASSAGGSALTAAVASFCCASEASGTHIAVAVQNTHSSQCLRRFTNWAGLVKFPVAAEFTQRYHRTLTIVNHQGGCARLWRTLQPGL